MFKVCPRCGAQNAPDAKFCVKCGFNLSAVPTVTHNELTNQSGSAAGMQQQGTGQQQKGPQVGARPQQQQAQAPYDQQQQNQYTQQQQAPYNQQGQPNPGQNLSAQLNPAIQRAKKYSGNYFSTLLQAWRHPSATEAITGTEKKYFGYVTILLIAILATLDLWAVLKSVVRIIESVISAFGAGVSSYLGGGSDSNYGAAAQADFDQYMNGRVTGLLLQFFVYMLIILAVIALMGFLTQRFFIGDPTVTFTDFTNRFAFRASGTLPVLALLLLFAWLGAGFFGIIIIGILLAIYQAQINVALFVTSNEGTQHSKLDRVYSLAIMLIAVNVLTTFILSMWAQGVITRLITR